MGRSVGGFVKNDKVPDLASDHAFALATLLFGNVVFGPTAVMPALVAAMMVWS